MVRSPRGGWRGRRGRPSSATAAPGGEPARASAYRGHSAGGVPSAATRPDRLAAGAADAALSAPRSNRHRCVVDNRRAHRPTTVLALAIAVLQARLTIGSAVVARERQQRRGEDDRREGHRCGRSATALDAGSRRTHISSRRRPPYPCHPYPCHRCPCHRCPCRRCRPRRSRQRTPDHRRGNG